MSNCLERREAHLRKALAFRTPYNSLILFERLGGKQNASKTRLVHDFQSASANLRGSASACPDDLYGSNVVEVAIILTKITISK